MSLLNLSAAGLVVFLSITAAATAARTEDRLLFVGGAGALNCKDWIETRETAARVRAQPLGQSKEAQERLILESSLKDWVLGYMSGASSVVNSGATSIKATMLCETNERDIVSRMDNFCKVNPTRYIVQAVQVISRDLMRAESETLGRAIEYGKTGFKFSVTCWPSSPHY
jgi:hypothetical protein